MIRDSFWTDTYIEKLTPDEKLLFIYLLTNPLCNVAGVYEIRAKRIGFETGYDVEVVETILKRFERDKKILRFEDWIVVVNHIKNQSLNPSIIQGCERIFNELPQDMSQAVTGWVQAGLLNLTLLNLTLPNPTLRKKAARGGGGKNNVSTLDTDCIQASSSTDDGFVEFWTNYPRKIGKGAAEKSWGKLKPPLEIVISAIHEQKKTNQWSRENGQFIPHPATWLNQKRWEDEVETFSNDLIL